MLEIDENGLDEMDKRILETVIVKFGGGPVGISSLAVAVGEEPDTLEEVYEPYLIMEGYLKRTPQGPRRDRTELQEARLEARKGQAAGSPLASDFRRDHKGLPVIARQQLVRLPVADEPLGLWVHLQHRAQRGRRLLQVHVVGGQVLFHAAQRLGQVLVALDRLANFVGRLGLAQPIGDVAGVAQRAGEVAFQDVGVQVARLAAAHGVNEVGEVAGAARELLDLRARPCPGSSRCV